MSNSIPLAISSAYDKDEQGNYSFTLPSGSGTYDVALSLKHFKDGSTTHQNNNTPETYTVVITDASGTQTSTETTFAANWDALYTLIEDVSAGSTITIDHIQIALAEEASWGNDYSTESYTSSSLTAVVTEATGTPNTTGAVVDLTYSPSQTVTLVANDTTSVTAIAPSAADYSGNYTLVLPEDTDGTDGKDETYDITFAISHTDANNGAPLTLAKDETYYVTFTYPAGTDTTTVAYPSGYYLFKVSSGQVALSLTDIPAGTTITLQDVRITYILGMETTDAGTTYTHGSYLETDVYTTVLQSGSEISTVTLTGDNPASLQLGQTAILTATASGITSDADRMIDDTFLTLGGEYSILYMLNNYNVVSLDNIESTHIVGPIIAVDIAQRTQENVIVAYDYDATTNQSNVLNTTTVGANPDSTDTTTNYLAASDYANGISSYVGTLVTAGSNDSSAFVLNYGFEYEQTGFIAPYFYTNTTGVSTGYTQSILAVGTTDIRDNIHLADGSADGALYVSPNYSGQQYSYQSNDSTGFIDVAALTAAMEGGSDAILENGTAEDDPIPYAYRYYYYEDSAGNAVVIQGTEANPVVYDVASGTITSGGEVITTATCTSGNNYTTSRIVTSDDGYQLSIGTGESWMILTADKLNTVDIVYPDGYDYFTDPYPIATTINFVCETINPTYIDIDGAGTNEAVLHSQIPTMLVNGEQVRTVDGENGEYGEGGKKIIWNMPNVVTNSTTGENRLVTYGTSDNILGHIIAPQAEFWNYGANADATLYWEGGNINGGVIVKSFYSGEAEMHMWPYMGDNEIEKISYNLAVTKTVNGEAPLAEFSFTLTPTDTTAANAGLVNSTFPLTATTAAISGDSTETASTAEFASLVFIAAGEYQFYIQESIPAFTNSSGIIYDLSQYLITIKVGTDANGDLEITSVTQTRTLDEDGETVTAEPPTYTITDTTGSTVYTYNDGGYSYTGSTSSIWFDNTNPAEETFDAQFIKMCTSGHTLAGAVFRVSEMAGEYDTSVVENGYYATVTSDASGVVHIQGLATDTYYILYEVVAPAGHVAGEGYWVIYVNSIGQITTDARSGADPIDEDNYIYNEPEAETTLDVTLTKANQFNIALANVAFTVQRVVIEDGVPSIVNGGYSKTYTSGADGTFTVTDLSANYVYMITETSNPNDDYAAFTGYWLIETSGDLLHPSLAVSYTLAEYDANNKLVSTITDDTLHNEKILFILPETGGGGTATHSLCGTALLGLAALAFYQTKRTKRKEHAPKKGHTK